MGYDYVGPVAKDSGTGNLPIHRIVIHCTVGADAKGGRGTAEYFRSPSARGSAHAIVDANETLICAHDNVICWHAPPNSHSYGIELCCSLSNQGSGHWTLESHQKMLRRAAKLVAEKCHAFGIPVHRLSVGELRRNANAEGICGHIDVSNAFHQSTHWDPGPYFPWSQFMDMVQEEYTGGSPGGQTEEQELAGAVQELKNFVEDRVHAYSDRNVLATQQQLAGFREQVEAIVEKWATATNTYTRQLLAGEDVADDASLAELRSELKAQLDLIQADVDATLAKVSVPKAP